MGKRKRKTDEEYLLRKIKRYEEKLRKKRKYLNEITWISLVTKRMLS